MHNQVKFLLRYNLIYRVFKIDALINELFKHKEIFMDDLWGELVLVKGKPTVNISKKIKKNEIEDTSRHFLLHITNLRIWEELSKDKNRKPQELKESISGSEEDIVIKVHALLANSYCECGNNNHMKF